MIKVGQIGNGNFGNKIYSKLKSLPEVSVAWVMNNANNFNKTKQMSFVKNQVHYLQILF